MSSAIWSAAVETHRDLRSQGRSGTCRAYLSAADPGAVTSASWIIERILRESPEAFGESRDGELRVGFEPPLAVWYSISQSNHLVLIVSFRLFDSGKAGRG